MPDIVLTTLNARYAHASFGLRYLRANLGELRDRSEILEFDINQRTVDVLERILSRDPKIVGLGVYIWNALPATQLDGELKRIRPDIQLVVGGPEVSYETDQQEITRHADYVITGEADLAFARLGADLLAGRRPLMKVIPADLPEFDQLKLPYDLYDEQDIAHRVIYVEASRGCPFKCEFCLSSLDVPVRNAPLDQFLLEMGKLLDRGVRQFKFVDRTFNLNLKIGQEILRFFHERYTPGLFLHFEMIPDRLPEGLRQWIAKFPPGALQFEVGIQTFNEEVSERISRKQDNAKIEENFRFLRESTGVHIHADLIVGLPGEDIESFGSGFDRLLALGPQEIQVGMLKRLRGTPIIRHGREFGMVYSPQPPYEILQTGSIDFSTMQRLRRFARYWDLIGNSGNFKTTLPFLWRDASPFSNFLAFSDWLYATAGQTHSIALNRLAELLYRYIVEQGRERDLIAQAITEDYHRCGKSDRLAFLAKFVPEPRNVPRQSSNAPRRQSRHLP
jgi:radical SAM superfamily enzyme YgiQ (UPF0313 family)